VSGLSAEYIQPAGGTDNHAKHYDHILVEPLASAMGAAIKQTNLSKLNDTIFEEIVDALYQHKMVYFRDQNLTFADQENPTQRFRSFGVDAYTAGLDGHLNIQRVLKEADQQSAIIFGGSWHTNSSFLQ
jgi:alpha-ketoglutarate-dependent taurine dioxygenase